MSRKDPPALTDPYATGSAPPPAPEPVRGSMPSVPNLPPPRLPSIPEIGRPSGASSPDLRVSAPSLPAAPAPPDAGGAEPPTQARPKPRRTGLIVGLLVGLGVLAAGGAGGWLWHRSRPAPVLPFDVKSLPEGTVAFSRDDGGVYSTGLHDGELPPEAGWSHLSKMLCGGTDVFALLMRPSDKSSRFALADALVERRQLSAALACGRALGQQRDGRVVYRVVVKLPEEKRDSPLAPKPTDKDAAKPPPPRLVQLALFPIAADKLPDTSKRFKEARDRGGLGATHCLMPDDGDRRRDEGCADYAAASAHLEGTRFWVGGAYAGLSLFGRDFSPKASNKIDKPETWDELAAQVRRYPYAEIGTHEAFNDWFVFHTGFGRHVTEDKEIREILERLSETVAKYEARWTLGDAVGAEGGELRLDLFAAGDSEAIDLLLDLKEWHAALKDRLKAMGDDADPKVDEDKKRVERDYLVALHESGQKAIEQAHIERDGRRVVFVATVALSDSEREKIAAMRELALQRSKDAAIVVAALTEGDKPDESVLRSLGGGELLDVFRDPEKAKREMLDEKPRRE